jgi:hypothetical protein
MLLTYAWRGHSAADAARVCCAPDVTSYARSDTYRAVPKPFDEVVASIMLKRSDGSTGAELFRLAAATPPTSFLTSPLSLNRTFSCDHKNAQLWLPAEYVEPKRHPRSTVLRELEENWLHMPASSRSTSMITCTAWLPYGRAYDVSLWYVVRAKREQSMNYDESEFSGLLVSVLRKYSGAADYICRLLQNRSKTRERDVLRQSASRTHVELQVVWSQHRAFLNPACHRPAVGGEVIFRAESRSFLGGLSRPAGRAACR